MPSLAAMSSSLAIQKFLPNVVLAGPFLGSMSLSSSVQPTNQQPALYLPTTADLREKLPPYPLFLPSLIPGMVRKMQIGNGISNSTTVPSCNNWSWAENSWPPQAGSSCIWKGWYQEQWICDYSGNWLPWWLCETLHGWTWTCRCETLQLSDLAWGTPNQTSLARTLQGHLWHATLMTTLSFSRFLAF